MAQQESLEMDETLEKIVFYSFDEAKGKLEQDGECAPFTVVVSGDQMFVENYPDEGVEMCRANAEANVKTASTFASHYVFCYDGFLETNQGALDAIIVEAADCDMEQAYVIGLLYTQDEGGARTFKDQPAFIDYTPTFFDAEAVAHARDADGEEEDELVKAASEIAAARSAAGGENAAADDASEAAETAAGQAPADGASEAAAAGRPAE